jgi:hypothetical protein
MRRLAARGEPQLGRQRIRRRAYLFVSTAFGDGRHNLPLLVGRPGRWSAPVDALPVLPAWATPVADGGTT